MKCVHCRSLCTASTSVLRKRNAGQASTDQTVKDIQLALDGINEQLAQLATTNNALIVLDALSEQVDRLAQQTEQQQQVIDAVDASRKQLTQRIIDLDGRVNLALSPRSNMRRAVFNQKGSVGKSALLSISLP